MKPFKEMTSAEIKALSNEEFDNISPFEKHSCYDCKYLKGYISLWCTNFDAREYRRTGIPGIIKCHFWAPNWKYIDDKYKTSDNGYVVPVKRVKNLFQKIFSIQKK